MVRGEWPRGAVRSAALAPWPCRVKLSACARVMSQGLAAGGRLPDSCLGGGSRGAMQNRCSIWPALANSLAIASGFEYRLLLCGWQNLCSPEHCPCLCLPIQVFAHMPKFVPQTSSCIIWLSISTHRCRIVHVAYSYVYMAPHIVQSHVVGTHVLACLDAHSDDEEHFGHAQGFRMYVANQNGRQWHRAHSNSCLHGAPAFDIRFLEPWLMHPRAQVQVRVLPNGLGCAARS